MPVKTAEFIRLPFESDLSRAGVEYAKRNQMRMRERFGALTLDIMRGQAAGAAGELAFRRWLDASGIAYTVSMEAWPIETGMGTVILGGRRCELEVMVVDVKRENARFRSSPDLLLNTKVSAQKHTLNYAGETSTDLLVFGLVHIDVTRDREESKTMEKAGISIQMAVPLPDECMRPERWQPMGAVEIVNCAGGAFSLDVVGYGAERKLIVEEINLVGNGSATVEGDFFTLGSLYRRVGPINEIAIQIERFGESLHVAKHQWGNVWIYGQEILLLGYLARMEYQRIEKVRLEAMRLPGGDHTSRGVLVRELRPLGKLLFQASEWAG